MYNSYSYHTEGIAAVCHVQGWIVKCKCMNLKVVSAEEHTAEAHESSLHPIYFYLKKYIEKKI